MTRVTDSIALHPIGIVSSPYKEKFAIPRQPGLVTSAKGTVKLLEEVNNIDSVRALEQFSHIWLLFVFHGTQAQGWKPLVRPPRLGGNKKVGVLSTRSTFRPNPIGMSVVKLDEVKVIDQDVILHISGMDLLDKTPIVDIKPYIPYSDSITNADAGFAQTEPQSTLTVTFSEQAQSALNKLKTELPELTLLIEQVLTQDPRPAYKQDKVDEKIYGMKLHNLNIQWQIQNSDSLEVLQINAL